MRKNNNFLILLWFGLIVASAAQDKPNIIFFLADDLGWTGLRCFGSDYYETPHLDKLAAEGMKFTNAYSACTVCSPSRGAIMTGLYPAKSRLTDFIAGQNRPYAKMNRPEWTMGLEKKHTTIAEALKQNGYRTGQVGKWHLDFPGESVGPKGHGFDYAVDKPKGTKGYHIKNAKPGEPNYVTDYLTDRAVEFIEQDTDNPFYLYFAYHVPHTPIQGRADLVDYFKGKYDPELIHNNPVYAAMVKSMDMSVGKVMECLKKNKLLENTIVIFTSDNGGLTQRYGKHDEFTENKPLRRGKGSAFEGGVRVPTIAWSPSRVKAGQVCETPIISVDFYPTILAITNTKGNSEHNKNLDGLNLSNLFEKPRDTFSRSLYWHYPHYHAGGDWPYSSIRTGKYRLIESLEDGHLELYDLESDLGESKDLSKSMPEKCLELKNELRQWRERVAAQMPTANKNYDPDKATQVAKKKK